MGGLLLGVTTIPVVLSLDVVTFVWSAVLVLGLRPRVTSTGRGGPVEPGPGGSLAGFRVIGSCGW